MDSPYSYSYATKVEDQLTVPVYADDVSFTTFEQPRKDTQPDMFPGETLEWFTQEGDLLGMSTEHLHKGLHDGVGDRGRSTLAAIVDKMILWIIVVKEGYEVFYSTLKKDQSAHGWLILLAHSSILSLGLIGKRAMDEAGMMKTGVRDAFIDLFHLTLKDLSLHVMEVEIAP